MKRILIFSGCLLLILFLASMHQNSQVSVSSHSSSSLLLVSGFSISPACLASSFMFDQASFEKNNKVNIDRSYLLWHHIKSNSPNISISFYYPQMLGWATWICLPLRSPQPYRNPQRRFRLNKKQRRRLRRRLCNLLAAESAQTTVDVLSSSLKLA